MIQKTALSFYRTIVLTGLGFLAGAVAITAAYEKTNRLTPRPGAKDDRKPRKTKTPH